MTDFKPYSRLLLKTIKKYKNILIYIKGSPDPDAIAASYVFKLICEKYNIHTTIDSPMPPSLPQNIKILKELHIPVQFKPKEDRISSYDAYAVLDHPSVDIENITGIIPCAVHIDHHRQTDDKIPVESKIIIPEAGSTSTIMVLLLNSLPAELKWLFSENKLKVATALYFGIRTDTDQLQYATKLDEKALEIIAPGLDRVIIRNIENLPMPKEVIQYLNLALKNQVAENGWLVTGLGFIQEKNRDVMAIIADLLMKRDDISKVVVFAIIEKKKGFALDACLRTNDKKFNLDAFIKKITQKGGARAFKGAYQVNLDYFSSCPDRNLLWKLAYITTMETLKRLGVSMEIAGEGNYFSGLKNKVKAVLKNFFIRK